ncbi:3-deoxy-manno-octulosonate cytidylyltransferase [Iocasia frigidifontis]|uniref:3-deoxy-manno-octulosonate cytidylyltransferase n=1 Tax=Iocasia fonsfrigidae TaxID=2682810 RepID=A0A8A7KHL0_9FIRM|nr:3-deoxy-manno-octulosonate cytidylyltransferase [Iocasia fonsfrigidae]QTL99565.1 3-deoxy-manno-octulosonate cytidylyltransferase [Iocasia fonsfrigidae]
MKIVAVIPARLKSTRLPNKVLTNINGKPMIQHVYERVSKADLYDVVVACDDKKIYDIVKSFGGKVMMTRKDHINGSSRIAEVASAIDVDIIINVQGDEPLINSKVINQVIEAFSDEECVMATLKQKIENERDIMNPNCVKVITDKNSNAIYFSRYPLPYLRENKAQDYFKHIGIYGYKREFLLDYVKMEPTELEIAESLEQLRVIENGFKIKVLETDCKLVGVDTQDDLKRVSKLLKHNNV